MNTLVRKTIVIGALVLFGVMSFAQESIKNSTEKATDAKYFTCNLSTDGESLEIILKEDYPEEKLVIPTTIKDYPVSRITIENPLDSLKEIVCPDIPVNVEICYALGLTKLTIPQVRNLEELYLAGCKNLKELIIGKIINPNVIRHSAFFNCGLECFNVPEGVEVIESAAFNDCKNLKSITLPKSITTIKGEAFAFCFLLEKIVIPEGVEVIGERAFYGCFNLKSITLPKSITTISSEAFGRCSSLEEIIIPESVTKIVFEKNIWFPVTLNLKTQARLRQLGYSEPLKDYEGLD